MPTLAIGELALATDEAQLYIGTASGNELVLASQTGIGNGGFQNVSAPMKGTGGGPSDARHIVNFAKVVIGGVSYWIPLML